MQGPRLLALPVALLFYIHGLSPLGAAHSRHGLDPTTKPSPKSRGSAGDPKGSEVTQTSDVLVLT